MDRFTGVAGIVFFLAVAYAMSHARRRIRARIVVGGIALQVVLATLLLVADRVVKVFQELAKLVVGVIDCADRGTEFIFGPALMDETQPWGFIFAVKVLPIIVYFAALMSVAYHLGIMQRVIAACAWVMRRVMGVGGAESLCTAANIFVGQTEAPLCVKPYLSRMTRSQLMIVMTGGFATIAGSVMAAYIDMLGGNDPGEKVLYAKHLMTASLMSAPAAFVIAKMIVPETEPIPDESLHVAMEKKTRNVLDALAAGATDGLKLALNVAAMLVAFVAVLALLNWPLEAFGDWEPIAKWRAANGIGPFSLIGVLGWIFTPVAFLIGIPWADCPEIGGVLGTQVIATEFVAYVSLTELKSSGAISPRAAQITTYALCGFANFPSIAIQIGGLSAIAPERRNEFVSLGLRAMVGGLMACWMTASIAGVFIRD